MSTRMVLWSRFSKLKRGGSSELADVAGAGIGKYSLNAFHVKNTPNLGNAKGSFTATDSLVKITSI